MRNIASVVLATLFCGLMAVQVGAVGKTTADPNASAPKVDAAKAEKTASLDQLITYEARRKSVKDILSDLSTITGIKFYAGYNTQDWQVRDRKMNIYVEKLPLATLMNSMARVMKFKWSRIDDDKAPGYRLFMDRKTLLGAERERLLEEELLRKKLTKEREDCMAGFEGLSGLSSDEYEALKIKDPVFYMQAKFGWGEFLPQLFEQVPAARDAWLAGEELPVSISALSPELQSSLQRALATICSTYSRISGANIVPPPDVSNGTFMINQGQGALGYQAASKILGSVTVRAGQMSLNSDFVGSESGGMKSFANKIIAAMEDPEGKVDMEQLNKDASQELGQERTDLSKDTSSKNGEDTPKKTGLGEPLNVHPEDPSLLKKVKLNVDGNTFADILIALAKASDLAIVSDSFTAQPVGGGFPDKEIELKAILDKIESGCRYNWDKQANVLEFRDRDWFRKRAAQIPDAWLEKWRKAFVETGTLEIAHLSQISALSNEQYWTNILADDVLGGMYLANVISLNRRLLAFYACLNQTQQSLLFTKRGIDLAVLNSDQKLVADKLLGVSSTYSKTPGSLTEISGVKKANGKYWEYTFTVKSDGQATPLTWNFTAPPYQPPISKQKEEKPKEAK